MSKSDEVKVEKRKPFAFAPIPAEPSDKPPIWHDGSQSSRLLSGELRCELRNHTPMLVGWERSTVGELAAEARPPELRDVPDDKPVLYPLRMPSPGRPVLIPGDSLKGMLRHGLGALLGAPMERVEERLYSYRPNIAFPDEAQGRFLEPRLAKVIDHAELELDKQKFRYPTKIRIWDELLTRSDQTYLPRVIKKERVERRNGDHRYRSGMGAGNPFHEDLYPEPEPGKPKVPAMRKHVHVNAAKSQRFVEYAVPSQLIEQYKQTLRHYLSKEAGHFSRRHPGIKRPAQRGDAIATVRQGAHDAFQKGDVIWVEWNLDARQVTSFGWHYYYRWAYHDTVRTRDLNGTLRPELSPTPNEKSPDADRRPSALTAVRRLFGFTSGEKDDAEVPAGIGAGHYSQLMGRISINAALEHLTSGPSESGRFLPPTFLRELGQPRPSAVEHYLIPSNASRPDQAILATYGDTADRDGAPLDPPGKLAGRKVYLHRPNAPFAEPKETAQHNERSTLALDASQPQRIFRFTLRFRDLEKDELAALLLTLCPNQFAAELPSQFLPNVRTDQLPYLSKLGYARPLGWGSVEISAAELHFLEDFATKPRLASASPLAWFRETWPKQDAETVGKALDPALVRRWLELHLRTSDEAGDYPTAKPPKKDEPSRGSRRIAAAAKNPKDDQAQIYTYHTALRAQHARQRRYRKL